MPALDDQSAQQHLQESETFRHVLLEHLNAGVVIIDAQTHLIEDLNPAAADLFGAPAENILGHRCHQFVCPAQETCCPITDLKQEMDHADRILVRSDGTQTPILKSVKKISLGGKEKLLELFVDITERKLAEEALRASENFSRSLLENMHDPVVILSAQGTIQFANPAAGRLTSVEPLDSLVGQPMTRFLDDESQPSALIDLQTVLAQEKAVTGVYSIHTLSGVQRWVEAHGARIAYQGSYSELVTLRDITARLQAEEARKSSEMFARDVLDSLKAQICVVNQQGVILAVNNAWQHFAQENGGADSENILEGANYLRICQEAINQDGDPHATLALQNISRVLEGEPSHLSFSYPCHSPTAPHWFNMNVHPLRGPVKGAVVAHEEITDRILSDEALRKNEALLRTTLDSLTSSVHLVDHSLKIILVNEYLLRWCISLGIPTKHTGIPLQEYWPFLPAQVFDQYREVFETGRIMITQETTRIGDHAVVTETQKVPIWDNQEVTGVLTIINDITERKRAEEALRVSEARYRMLAENMSDTVWQMDMNLHLVYISPSIERLSGFTPEEISSVPLDQQMTPESFQRCMALMAETLTLDNLSPAGPALRRSIPIEYIHKDGSTFWTENTLLLLRDKDYQPTSILGTGRDITQRKKAEIALEKYDRLLHGVAQMTHILLTGPSLEQAILQGLGLLGQAAGVSRTYIFNNYQDSAGRLFMRYAFEWTDGKTAPQIDNPLLQALPYDIFTPLPAQRRLFYGLVDEMEGPLRQMLEAQDILSILLMPINVQDEFWGFIGFDECQERRTWLDSEIDILQTAANAIGAAIGRQKIDDRLRETYRGVQRQNFQLKIFHVISQAITLHTTPQQVMQTTLEQLAREDDIDAIAFVSYETGSSQITLAACSGLAPEQLEVLFQAAECFSRTRPGSLGSPRFLYSQQELPPELECLDAMRLGYPSLAFLPILLDEQTSIFLLVYSQVAALSDPEWQDFLHSIAMQTAISLENANMITRMTAASQELQEAYEGTLAGWAKALEMRDKETKGHSDRVLQLSLKLARSLKYPQEKLDDFRRGVLLHDIGKMAIPDSILFKPGSLNEAEWMVMRQHPIYAHQLLARIPYLASAIEIPMHHHEWWDGSGYPAGLQGSQIPLGARIFAVVDAWDGMTSDRPYHTAFPREAALQMIQKDAGIHFDPQVVEAFLKIIERTTHQRKRWRKFNK